MTPNALGHWLYMVRASAGMESMQPAATGATTTATREVVTTAVNAVPPIAHSAISASEAAFDV